MRNLTPQQYEILASFFDGSWSSLEELDMERDIEADLYQLRRDGVLCAEEYVDHILWDTVKDEDVGDRAELAIELYEMVAAKEAP